ncbi:hypothetical protein DL95DRAFT_488953 [Leptodontidium sp. 2 PMI_412]|nr:hypothetical protein DL95DRAFT_488953 [Leptodontidium sp. 2 PMI_412]
MQTGTLICGRCEAVMPLNLLEDYPCAECFPNSMWEPYPNTNPRRMVQEGTLYYKFDYSCILCRRVRFRENIAWVTRRYRISPGTEGEPMLEDLSPPLWTCDICYPRPRGMWLKRRAATLPSNPIDEGPEEAGRSAINPDQSDQSDRLAAPSDDRSSRPSDETPQDCRPASDREMR